jgi:hypothetical protein
MGLYLVDCFLAKCRVELVCGRQPEARASLQLARNKVNTMKYHRRDKEIAELEAKLSPP